MLEANRRTIRKHLRDASIAALAACAVLACGARKTAAIEPPDRSHAVIASAAEPGEPLEVHGVVYEPDGVTPASGVVVYVYHTDANGLYHAKGEQAPRLRAWMVTDELGRYSYRTIKPAPYPRSTIAAHVHTQLWSERVPRQYNTDLEFRDDRFVTERDLAASEAAGRFRWVATLERDAAGVWQATHDLRVKPTGDEFEDNTMHGWLDCPPELRREP